MHHKAQDYNYSVKSEGGIFIALVAEFPSLAAHGDTKDEALEEIQEVVENVLEDLVENDEPVPEPQGA